MTAPGGSPGATSIPHPIPLSLITAYDTTELATTAGEELTLIKQDDPSGWAWVRNAAGREGWVPLRTIEPVPGQ